MIVKRRRPVEVILSAETTGPSSGWQVVRLEKGVAFKDSRTRSHFHKQPGFVGFGLGGKPFPALEPRRRGGDKKVPDIP